MCACRAASGIGPGMCRRRSGQHRCCFLQSECVPACDSILKEVIGVLMVVGIHMDAEDTASLVVK